jgi:nickel/cobalt transporter (NicO) family protein
VLVNDHATFGVLLGTATAIAVGHTLIGVDHTLPFVVMGKARGWSLRKVLSVTALCGFGHVMASVVLGLLGAALGTALEGMQWLQEVRGSLAAWLLIAFGMFFAVRAWVRAARGRAHSHAHAHEDGVVHEHPHAHDHAAHTHAHDGGDAKSATVWALFVIFVLGPCEPLIPLMLAPAAMDHWLWVAIVALVFGAATIFVMLAVVTAGYLGLGRISVPWLERQADVFAGLAIASSGIAIQTLGI